MPYELPDVVKQAVEAANRMDAATGLTPPPVVRTDADLGLPYYYYNMQMPDLDREEFAPQPWVDELVPEDGRTAPGVETIEQIRATYSAVWRIFNDYQNNISKADVQFQRLIYGNVRFGSSFNYSLKDRDREALTSGRQNPFAINIVAERRRAVRESWRQLRNQLFSVGDAALGIFGALSHPDVPRAYGTFRPGLSSSAADNLTLLVRQESRIADRTNQVEQADTVIFPPNIYRELSQQPYVLLGGESVARTTLEQFLHASVSVKAAGFANELRGAGPNGEDVIFMYTNKKEKLCSITPMPYREQTPVRQVGEDVILCEGEVSGVHYKRPYSAELLLVPAA